MPQIHGSLTDDEFVAFNNLAKKRGIERRELVTQLVREAIAQEEKK